jgi:hypothetical protein
MEKPMDNRDFSFEWRSRRDLTEKNILGIEQ